MPHERGNAAGTTCILKFTTGSGGTGPLTRTDDHDDDGDDAFGIGGGTDVAVADRRQGCHHEVKGTQVLSHPAAIGDVSRVATCAHKHNAADSYDERGVLFGMFQSADAVQTLQARGMHASVCIIP